MQPNTTFLYVEDEPLSRLVMQMLLVRALGYENLNIFENSEHFIERVEDLDDKPDLVFLDIHMQPHNGFEMLSMLRQHPRYHDTRVIALTASVMNEEVDMLKNAGFNGAIAKPIDQVIFPNLLQSILNGEEVWHIV
jgi:two-component system, cell cycle response regulator DivK